MANSLNLDTPEENVKIERALQWARSKNKHHKDHNHGPGGFISGNRRYQRQKPFAPGNITMGKARSSVY